MTRDLSLGRAAAIAVFVGGVNFFCGIGGLIPDGRYDLFWSRNEYDISQAFIGLTYYLRASVDWGRPFAAIGLGPEGATPILFTDSLPWAALSARLINELVPGAIPPERVLGGWVALCYLLQPITGLMFLRALGVRSLTGTLAAAQLSFLPAMMFHFSPPSLGGHFLFQAQLAVWAATRNRTGSGRWAAHIALCALATGIHIYLAALSIFITAVSALDAALRKKAAAVTLLSVITTLAAVEIATLYLFGFFSVPPQQIANDYGRHALNLLSPIVPQLSSLFSAVVPHNIRLDPRWGVIPDDTGLVDAYNYMGLGILFLIAAAAGGAGGTLLTLLRRGWIWIAACVLLLGIALTPSVHVGDSVFSLAVLPDDGPISVLLNNFRFSARFFWPVPVLITALCLSAIHRQMRPEISRLIFVAAAALQFADSDALRREILRYGRDTAERTLRVEPEWRDVFASAERVSIYPSVFCLPAADYSVRQDLLLSAAQSLRPINDVYRARLVLDCAKQAEDVRTALDRGDLVLADITRPALAGIAGQLTNDPRCRPTTRGLLCGNALPEIPAALR